ncbi:hypothetical protein FA13DRAFT_1717095 [Coprinellus micaceus]|uniref:Uncharacterized protein n=1 Tax=Coprinellus micaceus TaxID=71717 RepID=A0A4Y7SHD7_COPMI|nr:hypothetical protein FA13DRAFT_1717095 [Coprinellus micaceus]
MPSALGALCCGVHENTDGPAMSSTSLSASETETVSGSGLSGEETKRANSPDATPSTSTSSIIDKRAHFDTCFKTESSTPEEVLATQTKTWTSSAYQHFLLPPKIKVESGKAPFNDEATSNLNHHVKACALAPSSQTQVLAQYVQGHSYSYARHHVGLVLWCAHCGRPFSIVEDGELIDLFKQAFAGVQMPSHVTVLRDMKEIHTMTKAHLQEMLRII